MSRYADAERQELADLLLSRGPDAPTVIEDWTTRDLAAHLVIRERRPDAAAGIVLRPLHAYSERVRLAMAARPYPELVELVRRPSRWSPLHLPALHELVNLMEYFVHHEDVRRAEPDWQPRELTVGQQAALWRRVPVLARMSLRRFPATLLIQAPGHGELSAGAGGEQARLVGPPGELIMFLFGRQRVSRAEVSGPPELADRLRALRPGS